MKATQNSRRKYIVTGIESSTIVSKEYNLKELLTDDDLEITYSLQEDLDSILNLNVGESKCMSISRDNSNDLGIIHRVS